MQTIPVPVAALHAILFAALLVPAPTLAWGARGHAIVGAIAEARLGPDARAMVRELLGAMPLADVSTWADAQEAAATRPWHYVNILASDGRYEARRDCPQGDCVVARIGWAATELARADEPAARLTALRWLVHLVADVHQPLHASPVRDRGGNDLTVRIGRRKQSTNLHRVWDGDVVDSLARDRDTAELARTVARRMVPVDAAAWAASLDPASWAGESAAEVKSIYAALSSVPSYGGILHLPSGYPAAGRDTAERRLAQAGVRLAAVLDRSAAERVGRSTVR